MDKKSKIGFGNLLIVVGAILLINGIFYSISFGLENGWKVSFFTCLIGTMTIFIGRYIKDGYFSFFS